MKNNDNDRLLAHKQQVDNERRAQAILRQREQKRRTARVMARIANARRAS